ncbi:MAG: hypothetical protein ABR926_24245 [Streptosporangiaceae bacterium]|jgi:hypothetical protein
MATEETNQPKSLSIVTITDNGPDLADQVEIREGPWENVKSLFVGRKEIALDKIHSELDRVQAELDDVLASIDTQPKHGFHLTEVEVSLGISGEGSIGVVSAGVEAGITLTFSK